MPVNIHFNRNPGGYELANNLETEIAGVAALDAVQGKKIKELIENCVPANAVFVESDVNLDTETKPLVFGNITSVDTSTYWKYVMTHRYAGHAMQVVIGIGGNSPTIKIRTCTAENGWCAWSTIGTNLPAFYVGSVITNKINPQNAMIVNSLTLQPGTYVITASVEFSSGFLADVSTSILVNDYQYCTNRGTGAGGGGMTPTTILELTTQSEIKLSVYQASSSEVELSKNQLQAIKLS
nr:MAG TPA: hypothetical protein [Caudoviricetes sp.]